jgi:hypothetical protein
VSGLVFEVKRKFNETLSLSDINKLLENHHTIDKEDFVRANLEVKQIGKR